jgi:hypothetical protein
MSGFPCLVRTVSGLASAVFAGPQAGCAVPCGCRQGEPRSEGVYRSGRIRSARLTRLREAMPLSNAIAGIDLRCEPGWLRRLIYPAFAALAAGAAPGRCAADATRSNMTCLMPSMRKPARSRGLNAACTSGLASGRLMNWGCVTWYS